MEGVYHCMTRHDTKTIAFTCITLNFHITVLFSQTYRAGVSTTGLVTRKALVCLCVLVG
jgi:hypothetical protein